MTDRQSTITPPPDRDRTTDRPLPTDKAPPEFVTLSEHVVDKFDSLDKKLDSVLTHMQKLIDVGLAKAFDEIQLNLAAIKKNSEMALERHTKYVNEVTRVHQENLSMRADLNEHDARLMLLESDRDEPPSDPAPETNGNGHDK
jgi:hypothetical protein